LPERKKAERAGLEWQTSRAQSDQRTARPERWSVAKRDSGSAADSTPGSSRVEVWLATVRRPSPGGRPATAAARRAAPTPPGGEMVKVASPVRPTLQAAAMVAKVADRPQGPHGGARMASVSVGDGRGGEAGVGMTEKEKATADGNDNAHTAPRSQPFPVSPLRP